LYYSVDDNDFRNAQFYIFWTAITWPTDKNNIIHNFLRFFFIIHITWIGENSLYELDTLSVITDYIAVNYIIIISDHYIN